MLASNNAISAHGCQNEIMFQRKGSSVKFNRFLHV